MGKRGKRYELVVVVLLIGLFAVFLRETSLPSPTGYQTLPTQPGQPLPRIAAATLASAGISANPVLSRDSSSGDLTCTLPLPSSVAQSPNLDMTYNFVKNGQSTTRLILDFNAQVLAGLSTTTTVVTPTFYDNSGYQNDVYNAQAMPVDSSGEFGWAVTFNGQTVYMGIPHSSSLNLGGEYTIELFAQPQARVPAGAGGENWKTLLAKTQLAPGDPNQGFFLRTGTSVPITTLPGVNSSNDELEFGYYDGNEWHILVTNNVNLQNGYIYYIVVVKRQNEMVKIFVNGVQAATSCEIGNCVDTMTDTNAGLAIGADPRNLGLLTGQNYFQYAGGVEEVRMWNRALSPEQITKVKQTYSYKVMVGEETLPGETWKCQVILSYNEAVNGTRTVSLEAYPLQSNEIVIPSSSPGSSGSGGSGISTFEFNVATTASRVFVMEEDDKINVRGVSSRVYRLKLTDIDSSDIEFMIFPGDEEFAVDEESSINLDLNDDGDDDITLEYQDELSNSRVRVKLIRISAAPPITQTPSPAPPQQTKQTKKQPPAPPQPVPQPPVVTRTVVEEEDTTLYKVVLFMLSVGILVLVIIGIMLGKRYARKSRYTNPIIGRK